MDRIRVVVATAMALLPAAVCGQAAQRDGEMLAKRGVTFYMPFEDSAQPLFSRTWAKPTYCDSIHYVSGKVGRAASLRTSRERDEGKVKGRASGLNFDAAGILYGERGAVAFWFQPPWDGDDPTIRCTSNSTGPSLLGVSSVEPTYGRMFIRWQIKGGAFHIWVVDSEGKWHGPNYGRQVKQWRKGEWRHLALAWDCRKGVRFFDNGRLVYDTWGKEQWIPATPWTVGIGSDSPKGRPETVRAADLVMDELFFFDRSLDLPDVQALMRGEYAAVSTAPAPELSGPEREARRKQFCLAACPDRARAHPTPSGWTSHVRLLDIRDIRTDFIEGRFLSDGLTTRRFRLAQGGLGFDRDVRLVPDGGAKADYALLVGRPADGSTLAAPGGAVPLVAGPDEAHRVALDPPQSEVTLSLKAGSSMGECELFAIRKAGAGGVADAEEVEILPYTLCGDLSALGDAAKPLWRNLCPTDRRALVASGSGAPSAGMVSPAFGKIHLMSRPAVRDMGVRTIRLRLALRRPATGAAIAFKVHDPFEPSRFRLLLDMALPETEAHEPNLDIELQIPGLILAEGRRLWIEAVADRQVELALGPKASGMALVPCPVAEVREPFSRSYLRFLTQEFRCRMSHNFQYYSRGIQRVNPFTVGLARILRFDPANERALAMRHWARLSPWPKWTRQPPGPASAPLWARLQRAAITEALAVIHWWIDHRQDATGYVVGNANVWNDDTKLFNEYAVFALLTGDEKLVQAMERYLDAHYAIGRMDKGYSMPLTDCVHSQEEASYLVPTVALLRYGDPVQVERLMENAANIPYWTGLVAPGLRHFKSNYYTATRMKTEGRFGRDIAMNGSTLVPASYLAWYNGHPTVRQWLVEYADAWCAAAQKATPTKPAGLLPPYVDFKTGAVGPSRYAPYACVGFQLLAAARLTGDLRFLEPMAGMLAHSGAKGVHALRLNAAEWRRLTGSPAFDKALLEHAEHYRAYVEDDKFFQRGVEGIDVALVLGHMLTGDIRYLELGLLNAWRNNARARAIYTEIDPDKDRVYPWGRVVLPWMMCGGNAINARASAPVPTVAVSWERTGTDFAAWVKEQSDSRLRVQAFNFGPEREVGIRVWGLAPGEYRLTCDGRARRVRLRRGSVIPLELPSEKLVAIELQQTESRPPAELLPDAAISKAEIERGLERRADGAVRLVVPVHNLGLRPLRGATLRVVDAAGRVAAEAPVPSISSAEDLKPKVQRIELSLPVDVAYPVQIEIRCDAEEITRLNNSCTVGVD